MKYHVTGMLGAAAVATLFAGQAFAAGGTGCEVTHWWTSAGESAAVKVFADSFDALPGGEHHRIGRLRGHANAHASRYGEWMTRSTASDNPARGRGLILAAPASGSGKTLVTAGLLRHLRDRGKQREGEEEQHGTDFGDAAAYGERIG